MSNLVLKFTTVMTTETSTADEIDHASTCEIHQQTYVERNYFVKNQQLTKINNKSSLYLKSPSFLFKCIYTNKKFTTAYFIFK